MNLTLPVGVMNLASPVGVVNLTPLSVRPVARHRALITDEGENQKLLGKKVVEPGHMPLDPPERSGLKG